MPKQDLLQSHFDVLLYGLTITCLEREAEHRWVPLGLGGDAERISG